MINYNLFIFLLNIYVSHCLQPESHLKSSSSVKEIIYSINEESEIGSFVGNLKLDAERKLHLPRDQLTRFELYDELQPYRFRVDQETGKLFVASRLDREALCPQPEMKPSQSNWNKYLLRDECQIHFSLLIASEHWINVIVTIHDINDHEPYFVLSPVDKLSKSKYTVDVPESVPVGYEVPLINAKDDDIGMNTVQSYSLRGPDLEPSLFSVSYKPPFTLHLLILGNLDAESKAVFTGDLVACDGGVPAQKCGIQPFEIRITDLNDNKPVFDQDSYKIQIKESTEPGSVLLKLNATDADSGRNGKVHYKFSTPVDQAISKHFLLEENTGELRLRSALNAKEHSRFVISVIAEDSGSNPLATSTVIHLGIEDVNDHEPWIDFRPAQHEAGPGTDADKEGFVVNIAENKPIGTNLGFIITGDEDLENNAKVVCALAEGSDMFELEHTNSAKGREMYKVSTKVIFDRERIPSGKVLSRISCTDQGQPRQTAQKTLTVYIGDVNEFSPEFLIANQSIEVYLEEGKPIGTSVFKAKAVDKDATPRIHYYLSREAQQLFHIDSETGELTNRVLIDREEIPVIRFRLFATDRDSLDMESKASVANVSLFVTDLNDNAPELTGPRLFEIVENRPGYSDLVGQLTAIDRDNEENGTIRYKLLSVFGHDNFPENYTFMISEDTGKIFTVKSLDRERQQKYTLRVLIYDLGVPISKNNTELITVTVIDENDNPPVWKGFIPYIGDAEFLENARITSLPSRLTNIKNVHTLGLFNITGPQHHGQRLGKLTATDADHIQNANITYQLLSVYYAPMELDLTTPSSSKINTMPKMTDLLILDRTTGELLSSTGFANTMTEKHGLIDVYFRASDNGNPSLETSGRLLIQLVNIRSSATMDFSLKGFLAFFNANNYPWILLAVLLVLTMCFTCACFAMAMGSLKRRPRGCCECLPNEDLEKRGKTLSQIPLGPQMLVDDGLVLDGQLSVLGKFYQTPNANFGYSEAGSLCRWNGDRGRCGFGSVGSPALHSIMGSTLERMHTSHTDSDKSTTHSYQLEQSGSRSRYGETVVPDCQSNACTLSPSHVHSPQEVNEVEDNCTASNFPRNGEDGYNTRGQKSYGEIDDGSGDSGRGTSENEPPVLESWKNNNPGTSAETTVTNAQVSSFPTGTLEYPSGLRIVTPRNFCNLYAEHNGKPFPMTTFSPSIQMIGDEQSLALLPPPPSLTCVPTKWKPPLIAADQYGINNPQFEDTLPSTSRQAATLPSTGRSLTTDGDTMRLKKFSPNWQRLRVIEQRTDAQIPNQHRDFSLK